MAAVLTTAEMRALEQEAIAKGEVKGLELMERAGRGVVEAILAEWPDIEQSARRAVVLCGPGNNGGDGFVVARLLKERGWEVEVFLYGDAERLPPDAKANHDSWLTLGRITPLAEIDPNRFWSYDEADRPRLWIDALFGIGLTRPLDVLLGEVLSSIDRVVAFTDPVSRIVALDVPSGLDSDSGLLLSRPDGSAKPDPRLRPLLAHLTVTFQTPKLGHYLAEGPSVCGKLKVVDLGLRFSPRRETVNVTAPSHDGSMPFQWAVSKHTGHKYSHGHALLLSGGCGKGGAARLAARGALRIGAGLVTLGVPPAALQENAARLDAIMLRSVRDAEALAGLLSDSRYNALVAGPGLGTTDREAALLHALLDASRGTGQGGAAPASQPTAAEPGSAGASRPAPEKPRPVVLDADALTLLSRDETLRAKLHPACVLTPHEGEFARLFPAIAEKWHAPATTGPAYSKVDAARDAARECGAVVLLKGPDTVIADPSGRAAISAAVYDRAAPWLATAGSGDVLAGMICGLLARGFQPFDAACTAAWLHVEAARSFGPGLIAEDLPEELPKVFRTLGV